MVRIISDGFLSHPPHSRNMSGNLPIDPGAQLTSDRMFIPQVVCFCDIPIDDLPFHMSKYSRFGLAFQKKFIISKDGSPVRYVPLACITSFEKLIGYYNTLIERPSTSNWQHDLYFSLARHVFSFIKFFDSSLPDDHPDNFYFEREWRVFGNIDFALNDVCRVHVPEEFEDTFRTQLPDYHGQLCVSKRADGTVTLRSK